MPGVDVGGTFTDVVAFRDGRIEVTKVPSDQDDPAGPVVEGARRLGVDGSAVFNHASTIGLNAVITRRLPKIGLLTTEGFRDMPDKRPRVAAAQRADRPGLAAAQHPRPGHAAKPRADPKLREVGCVRREHPRRRGLTADTGRPWGGSSSR